MIEMWVGAHIMRLRAATWGRPYPVIEKSGRAGACPRRKFSQSQRQGQAPALQINKLTDKPQFIGFIDSISSEHKNRHSGFLRCA